MIPSSWLSVVLFFLLIAPGVLFDLLAERRRVGPKESAFREIGRVIIASLGFTFAGLLVVAAVRAALPSAMPDPSALLENPHRYVVSHYGRVAGAVALELTVAAIAVLLTHWLLARRGGGALLRPISGWVYVLRNSAPQKVSPYVRVRLNSGTIYQGKVAHYTADFELTDRELVLAPPLLTSTADGDEAEPVDKQWERIVLRGSEIESIAVRYDRMPERFRPSRWQRGLMSLRRGS